MTANELARKMLEWQEAQAKADLLEMDIKAAVLELGETQNAGSVRASYSGGRKNYDYPTGWGNAVADGKVAAAMINAFTTIIPETTHIDYTAACKALKLDPPFTQSAPSVTLKIVA